MKINFWNMRQYNLLLVGLVLLFTYQLPLVWAQDKDKYVVLDARGTHYKVPRSVFSTPFAQGSTLETMFSGKFADEKQEDGSYFIDMDISSLKPIIHYLSHGKIHLDYIEPYDRECLKDNAEYLNIEGLVNIFTERKLDKKLSQIHKEWKKNLPTVVLELLKQGDLKSLKKLHQLGYPIINLKIQMNTNDVGTPLLYISLNYISIDQLDMQKRLEIAEFLLKNGADVNAVNSSSSSHSLILAINCLKDINLIKLLLKYGADRSLKNKNGKTALDRANQSTNEEIKKLVLEWGEKK